MKVHQLLSGAGPYDAVTTQALTWRGLMAGWGFEGGVYAAMPEPEMARSVRPAPRLERDVEPGDAVLVHYSAYSRQVSELIESLPNRRLLVYHNITPARYLWDHQPLIATYCAIGRDELPRLVPRIHAAAAVSAYNAHELEAAGYRDVEVIPNVIDTSRFAETAGGDRWRDGKRNLLFVGRVAPHKRHDLLIRAFALWQREHRPESRLTLVGSPLTPAYQESLSRLATDLGAEDVELPGPLPQPELNRAYAEADLFVCLSEHEGFCIPVLEAMHFGLPVVAHAAGGIPEVAGDAAVLLHESSPPLVAEAIEIVLSDEGMRREMARRGRQRLAEYSLEASAGRLRTWLERVLEV